MEDALVGGPVCGLREVKVDGRDRMKREDDGDGWEGAGGGGGGKGRLSPFSLTCTRTVSPISNWVTKARRSAGEGAEDAAGATPAGAVDSASDAAGAAAVDGSAAGGAAASFLRWNREGKKGAMVCGCRRGCA